MSSQVKGHVESERSMALRHHKTIALRIVRTAPKHSPIKGCEDVGNRQGGPDMSNIGPLRLLEDVPPNGLAGDRLPNIKQFTV